VNKKDEKLEDIICNIEVDAYNKFDKLTFCLIWEEKDWDLKKDSHNEIVVTALIDQICD
jgi:hypothetical protein